MSSPLLRHNTCIAVKCTMRKQNTRCQPLASLLPCLSAADIQSLHSGEELPNIDASVDSSLGLVSSTCMTHARRGLPCTFEERGPTNPTKAPLTWLRRDLITCSRILLKEPPKMSNRKVTTTVHENTITPAMRPINCGVISIMGVRVSSPLLRHNTCTAVKVHNKTERAGQPLASLLACLAPFLPICSWHSIVVHSW